MTGRSERPLGQGAPDPQRPEHNNGNIRIHLSALCVSPGDVMVATLELAPNAGVTVVAAYADGQTHGALGAGESDTGGRYVWRFPIAATAPPGQARIYVMATGKDWSNEGGGTGDATFLVAQRGDCR